MSTATASLGSAAEVKRLLAGLMLRRESEREGERGPLWLARTPSKLVSAEVEGDPVVRVSLLLPARAGAGTVAGAFLNSFAPDGRPFLQEQLAQWRPAEAALDASLVAEHDRRVRVQGYVLEGVAMVVVTVEA